MTKNNTCQVKILNKTYEIKCPDGEEANLLLAAMRLNDQMSLSKMKFKQLDNFQMLMLAALELSHELIISKNEQDKQRLQVTQFISSLETKINKAVGGDWEALVTTD